MTYTATFKSGYRATVIADTKKEARKRLRITGRGEAFTMTEGGTHNVFGKDSDDDYEEGE